MAKETKKQEDQLEEVQETLNKSGQWIEKNSKLLSAVILCIALVVCGILAVKHFVLEPKAVEASNENAAATHLFEAGDYQKALNGDDAELLGFAGIADEFGNQEGKLAALYAGLCEYNLGNYESAVEYLKDFSGDDDNVAVAAKVRLGDAYVELGEYDKAVKAFKAAAESEHEIIAPIALQKAGFVYLKEGKQEEANKVFEQIKDEYPMSMQAAEADKYIVK